MGEQGSRTPSLGCVAVKTFQPKGTGMDFGLFMALVALAWSAPVGVVGMAIRAGSSRMHSIQWEEIGVGKIAQPVHAVMAT